MSKYMPPKPKAIKLTQEKLDQSKIEKIKLEKTRKEILIRLQTAREMGDLSENGAYTAAKFELRDTDRKLRLLNRLIRWGKVVKSKHDGIVDFDSIVILKNSQKQVKYHLVSGFESDPEKGKLSAYSPLGKAILGKKKGDSIELETPNGQISYKIILVE